MPTEIPARITRLAEVRGEKVEDTQKFLYGLGSKLTPSRIPSIDSLRAIQINSSGLDGSLAYIETSSGLVFYSYPTKANQLRQYWVLRDKLSSKLKAEAYGCLVDIVNRYESVPPYMPTGAAGEVIIEAGAYVGMRAMRFAQYVAPTGRVIAIEIDEDNYRVMRKNIEKNGLTHVIYPIHAALWSTSGRVNSTNRGYEGHSLWNGLWRNHEDFTQQSVATSTLDDLVVQHNIDHVAYLNLMVNGAEYEVIKGARQNISRFHLIGAVSKYDADESDKYFRFLQDMGLQAWDMESVSIFSTKTRWIYGSRSENRIHPR